MEEGTTVKRRDEHRNAGRTRNTAES